MTKLTIGICNDTVFKPRWSDMDEDSQQEWARVIIDSFLGKEVESLSVEWVQAVLTFLRQNDFPEVVPDKYLRKLCPENVTKEDLIEAARLAASTCGFRVEERKKEQENFGFDFWCVPTGSSSSVTANRKMEFLSAEEWNYFAPCLERVHWMELFPAIGELELSMAIYANFTLQKTDGPMSVFRHQTLWMVKRFVHHCKEGGPYCATPPFVHVCDKRSELYGKLVWNEAFKMPNQEENVPAELEEDMQESMRCFEIVGKIWAVIIKFTKKSERNLITLGALVDFLKLYCGISLSEEMTRLFETSRNFEFDGRKQTFPFGRPQKVKSLLENHSILKQYLKVTGQQQHEVVELLAVSLRAVERHQKDYGLGVLAAAARTRGKLSTDASVALTDASTAASLSEFSTDASNAGFDEMAHILQAFDAGLEQIDKKLADQKKKSCRRNVKGKASAFYAPRGHSTPEAYHAPQVAQGALWQQPQAAWWSWQPAWPAASSWQPQPQPCQPGLQPPGSWYY